MRKTPVPRHAWRLPAAVPLLVTSSLVLLAPAAQAAGTTYLVDQAAGCSDAAGSGTSSTPFCTISAATKMATAGDTVQVAGGTYREQVNAPSGVTFVTTQGATLLGTDSLATATWTATGTTAWTTPLPGLAVPAQVFGSAGPLSKAAAADQTTAGSWFFDTATRLLYVDLGGATPTAADGLEVGMRSFGFLARNATGVVIDGFTLSRQNSAGVFLDLSTGDTVRNVQVSGSASYGINDNGGNGDLVTGVTASGNASVGIRLAGTTSSSVTDSTARNNGFHGVSVQGGSGAVVSGVVATGNRKPGQRVATGIDVSSQSTGATVERNTTFGNDDSGIEIYTGSTGAVVRRNVTYDNGDHGIDISSSASATVVSNTSVGNTTSGINVEGTSAGATLRDNIAVDDGVGSPRSKGNIRVDAASVTGTTIDRDLVFQSASPTTPLYEWAGVTYTSLAALQTATGQEGRGLATDPKFVSLSGRDLHLGSGSPAVDAADSDAPGWVGPDHDGKDPVDDTTVADTGHGPVTYADLGAFERAVAAPPPPPPPADAAPKAALTATPSTVTEGGTVTLDASGSTDDHGITGYAFDCGDGTAPTSGTSPTASCTYTKAGSYKPTVTVTDAAAQTDTASAGVTVSTAPPPPPPPPPPPVDHAPVAQLTASPTAVQTGDLVTLDASGSTDDNGISSYRFDCGTGDPATTQAAASSTCRYPHAGSFQPSVTVTDTAGQTSTATAAVTVSAPPPPPGPPSAVLQFAPASLRQGESVRLDASGSQGTAGAPIATYTFDCGPQPTMAAQQTPTATCTFRRTGTKTVSVVVTNTRGATATATGTVTVLPGVPPTARLSLSPWTVHRGHRVRADASRSTGSAVSPIVAYRFRCGTAPRTAWSTRPVATCRFTHPGWRPVTVWVKNSLGLTQRKTRMVHVVR